MNLITLILIALSLSLDAFAVAVTSGTTIKTLKISAAFRYTMRVALFFGFFQALMPTIGWLAGKGIIRYIEKWDHFVIFGILLIVGLKMIYESIFLKENEKQENKIFSFYELFILAIATSLDALAIGISLSLLNVSIFFSAFIIGIITFIVSAIGVRIGKTLGHLFENKLEVFGGLVLIGIGIKILINHLH
ncbi:MAG: manganese efflux pump [Spirochaetales bacterium]|jgi:putative Mn2+ efflux pump MntP|nr:manganese efflux pump MntP family protein [Exilispira sp.]NMC68337.1 manganese efflux pump [Spirochaetales bacterium]